MLFREVLERCVFDVFDSCIKYVYYGPGSVKSAQPMLLDALKASRAILGTGKTLHEKVMHASQSLIREYELLRWIPAALLVPSLPRLNYRPPSSSFESSTHIFLVKWCLNNSVSSQITTPVSAQYLPRLSLISALS
jgi:hypothetical protein